MNDLANDDNTQPAAQSAPPAAATENAPPATNKRRKASKSLLQELLETLLLTLILFTATKFSIQNYQVEGISMVPTLQDGERILVDKVSYLFQTPPRGDIVVFKYPQDPTRNFIKRVIGEPGDRIEIKQVNSVYRVFVNGKMLDEPYINQPPNEPYPASCANPKTCVPYVVPAHDLFVMGDNRQNSFDSRSWGPLPMSDMIGHAIIAYWPLKQFGLLANQFYDAPSKK